jgi:hypothetical protein
MLSRIYARNRKYVLPILGIALGISAAKSREKKKEKKSQIANTIKPPVKPSGKDGKRSPADDGVLPQT